MADVLLLLITAAFFVVAVAYVGLCERIVGPDEPGVGDAPEHPEAAEPVEAAR